MGRNVCLRPRHFCLLSEHIHVYAHATYIKEVGGAGLGVTIKWDILLEIIKTIGCFFPEKAILHVWHPEENHHFSASSFWSSLFFWGGRLSYNTVRVWLDLDPFSLFFFFLLVFSMKKQKPLIAATNVIQLIMQVACISILYRMETNHNTFCRRIYS